MKYSAFVPTRLTPEMAAQVRIVASELEITESAVLRLAVKRFLENREPISFASAINAQSQTGTNAQTKARRSIKNQKDE